jgi:predicted nucleotidyltransferase component of viral defense system
MTVGLARSVHVRLVRHAHSLKLDPNLVLTRYALERFLYRLSRSPHGDRFVLKGAMLMLVWLGETVRPTRDADLLALWTVESEELQRIMEEVCRMDVEPDGLEFDPSTVRVDRIRRGAAHGGRRVTLLGRVGDGRYRVQVDVGLGDEVVPEPPWIDYPTLLDFPPPRLRAYGPETLIAEKVHAMVELGERNTRIRDFFDVQALAREQSFDGDVLRRAIASTFAARVTISTLSDMYSAITTAIGTLKGPLHGGANEAVMVMLNEIGDFDNVEPFIMKKLEDKQKIMGFGHRVYKAYDPRANYLKTFTKQIAEDTGNQKLYEMSTKIEEIMDREVGSRGIYPNVDFYSATTYYSIGLDIDLFTPMFAMSRVAGWAGHCIEQLDGNRLIRPRARYVGPHEQPYVPIDER